MSVKLSAPLLLFDAVCWGGSRISGKGVYMYKDVGVRLADFVKAFLIAHENDQIISIS